MTTSASRSLFVMNTTAELGQAVEAYQAGRMGLFS